MVKKGGTFKGVGKQLIIDRQIFANINKLDVLEISRRIV